MSQTILQRIHALADKPPNGDALKALSEAGGAGMMMW